MFKQIRRETTTLAIDLFETAARWSHMYASAYMLCLSSTLGLARLLLARGAML